MDTFNKYSKEISLEYCKEKYREIFPRRIEYTAKIEITFGQLLFDWLDHVEKTSFNEEVDLQDFLQYTAIKANEFRNESLLQSVSWHSMAYIEDLSLVDWLLEQNLFHLDVNGYQHLIENNYKFKISLTDKLINFSSKLKDQILTEEIAFEASVTRDWEFLEFLLKNNCPTNISVYGAAAMDGNINVLQMLKDNKCSFSVNRLTLNIEPFSNATPDAIEWFAENMEVEEIQDIERFIIQNSSDPDNIPY